MKKTRDGVGRTFFWRSKPRACLVRPALGSCSPEKRKKKKPSVLHGMDEFLDYFFYHFVRGESTKGGVGCSISVLREGWEVVLLLREGWEREKGTITTRGGAGGACNGKHFWLMELLLDRTNYFNRFFNRLQKFCAGPQRFFIFLSCECETVILTLDSNF